MKIAIFGGGISGMTAALVLKNKLKNADVSIYTKDLGGNFGAGGLKYLKYSEYSEYFMDKCLPEISYGIVNPIGAIYHENEIYNFPLYLYNIFGGSDIQKKYWVKTGRDINKFDSRCMNDAFNFRTELSIDLLEKSLNYFIDSMVSKIQKTTKIINVNFNLELFDDVVNENDIVIYTLPLSLLSDRIGKKLKAEFIASNLNIHKYGLDECVLNKIWFDYLYVPDNDYKFHRISIDESTMSLHAEVNSDDNIDKDVEKFLNENFGSSYIGKIGNSNIKGQITTDIDIEEVEKVLPDNVVLLGRFAEWNKRIVWSDVVEKIVLSDKLSKLYIK
jgi:hypothetical protein